MILYLQQYTISRTSLQYLTFFPCYRDLAHLDSTIFCLHHHGVPVHTVRDTWQVLWQCFSTAHLHEVKGTVRTLTGALIVSTGPGLVGATITTVPNKLLHAVYLIKCKLHPEFFVRISNCMRLGV
jgi:hypothetical protein